MEKMTAITCPVLVLALAAFGAAAAEVAPGTDRGNSGIGAVQRQEADARFARQDKQASKSRALFRAEKYGEAIETLSSVIDELALETDNVDAWIARERHREFSAELKKMQLAYGEIKLKDARKAYAEGRYNDAISSPRRPQDLRIV